MTITGRVRCGKTPRCKTFSTRSDKAHPEDSSSVPESSSSESAGVFFFDLAGFACNSSTQKVFSSVCTAGNDSSLSRKKRRLSGTWAFVLGEEDETTGLNKNFVNCGRRANTKVVLSISQEKPPNVHINVQPLHDKLIPHFCVKLPLDRPLFPSTPGRRAC